MDKSISARRKAQQLARNGDLAGAVEELDRVLQAGEGDPYDFVFRGDVLARMSRFDEAVFAYEEAISAYERDGLYRNAIAICKKVLRTDPSRKKTHGRLGDLYSKEGLGSDAVTHFLSFLDSAGAEATGEEFLETLERVADMAGQRPEATLRIADLFVRVGREERASKMLLEIAEQTENSGAKEIAMELRARARAILPPPPAETPAPATSEAQVEIVAYPVIEPSALAVEPSGNGGSKPATPVPEAIAAEAAEPDAIDPGAVEDAGCEIEEEGVLAVPYDDAKIAFEMPVDPAPAFELTPVLSETQGEAAAEPRSASAPSVEALEERREERSRCDRAIAEKDWVVAREIAEAIYDGNPEDADALEKLVFVSKELGDTLATVRYLILLGDLKINEEEFAASLECFLNVMEFDPENVTARRRLARFRDMNIPGAERITEECRNSIQGLLDTAGATVFVRNQDGMESEEWFDLAALLHEFREGASKQIDPNDAEGHYDLGLSHHEMGLYEEAVEEFGIVLGSQRITREMELKAREMRGECLGRLERNREAIHEYRVALEIEGLPERKRTPILYRLACSLELVGERDEARGIFQTLSSGETPFLDTRTHLDRLGG